MALDGTYAGLQAAIANYLHRSDLTAKIPDYIALAEGEMNRGITVRKQIARISPTIAAEYLDVPADFSGARVFRLTSGTSADLQYVGPEQMADLKDQDTSTGEPQVYTIVGGSFEFYPVPDGSYTAMLSYYQTIPSLAVNDTNWVLTTYPDVYLQGALKWAFIDLKDDARAQEADALFQRAMDQVDAQSIIESIPGVLMPSPSPGWVV